MAPMGVDPGIEAGFKAADQQSYLQQVLQNTRAEQNNAATLKAQQEQRTFDPEGLGGPGVSPDEHLARKADMQRFASGAMPGPNGTPLYTYKDDKSRDQAIAYVQQKATERGAVQGDKSLAAMVRQNLQPQHMGPDGQPLPMIAQHLNTLEGTNPLDPNRTNARNILGALGKRVAPASIMGEVDETGKPIPGSNATLPAGTGGAEIVTPDSPEGIRRRRAGQTFEEKSVIDPKTGLTQRTYDWKDRDQSQLTRGDVLSMLVDENSPNFPAGTSLDNLTERQQATLSRRMLAEQKATKVGTALTINQGKQEQAATGPLKRKDLGDYFNPQAKMFAINDPAMIGADPDKLQKAGYLHTSAWGTSKDLVAEIQNVNTADAHLNNVRKFIARNPDLYPEFDAQHPLSGLAAARVQQLWRGLLDGSDPRIAELKALDRSSLNILAAIAPPKNMRSGYSLLRYASEGLVNPTAIMSHQGALANIQGWEDSVKAAAKGRLTGVHGSQGPQVGTEIDSRQRQPLPGPPSAGVSGGAPSVADWLKGQQK